jgi:hypothetical protein
MNTALRWKILLAFVLVFFAGIACGFFGAIHGGIRAIHRMRSGSLAEHMRRHLQTELKLTPEQVVQISPIIDRTASQLETKRQQTAREVRQIFEQSHREIAPFLTPDQRTRLESMEQRHRRPFRRHGLFPGP